MPRRVTDEGVTPEEALPMHVKNNSTYLSTLPFLRFAEGDGSGSGGSTEGTETGSSGGSAGSERAAGGNNDSTGSQGGETPPQKQSESQPAAGKSSDGSGDASKLKTALEKERDLKRAAEKKVSDQAAEREQDRVKHQQALDDIAERLGLKPKDQPADPAALERGIAERDARNVALEGENAGLRTELAAWKSAVENGANPLYLMDRRSFLDELAKLDRKSDKFGEQLDAAVKAAIERDESLKAATTPRTPRPDPSQGSGRPAPTGAERGMAEAQRRFGSKTTT